MPKIAAGEREKGRGKFPRKPEEALSAKTLLLLLFSAATRSWTTNKTQQNAIKEKENKTKERNKRKKEKQKNQQTENQNHH